MYISTYLPTVRVQPYSGFMIIILIIPTWKPSWFELRFIFKKYEKTVKIVDFDKFEEKISSHVRYWMYLHPQDLLKIYPEGEDVMDF